MATQLNINLTEHIRIFLINQVKCLIYLLYWGNGGAFHYISIELKAKNIYET